MWTNTALLAVFSDPFALDRVGEPLLVQNGGDRLDAVGEQVQIDVRAATNVTGQGAADQAGAEGSQDPHHAEGLKAHVAEVFRPLLALVEACPDLDLVADLAIAGQIARFEIAVGDAPGRFEFGAEVLGFLPLVHQPGGLPSHLATNLITRHPLAPTQAARDTGNGRIVGVLPLRKALYEHTRVAAGRQAHVAKTACRCGRCRLAWSFCCFLRIIWDRVLKSEFFRCVSCFWDRCE